MKLESSALKKIISELISISGNRLKKTINFDKLINGKEVRCNLRLVDSCSLLLVERIKQKGLMDKMVPFEGINRILYYNLIKFDIVDGDCLVGIKVADELCDMLDVNAFAPSVDDVIKNIIDTIIDNEEKIIIYLLKALGDDLRNIIVGIVPNTPVDVYVNRASVKRLLKDNIIDNTNETVMTINPSIVGTYGNEKLRSLVLECNNALQQTSSNLVDELSALNARSNYDALEQIEIVCHNKSFLTLLQNTPMNHSHNDFDGDTLNIINFPHFGMNDEDFEGPNENNKSESNLITRFFDE